MPDIASVARLRWGAVAAALFVVMSVLWTAGSLHFGSAWIKTGSAHGINSILGYSETERGNVVHKENRSFLQQIAMFSGATTEVMDKFYIVRPAYAYMAAFLAPALGIVGAALAMNWLGWAIAAFCAWHFATRLFADPLAGLLAVAFVGTGMGFTVHIADYSAHLLAFATYYAGIVVLFYSRVWETPKSRAVHLALGAFLALCCLTYNMGLALVVAYAVIAIRHNRPIDVALGVVVALSAQYAWVATLNIGYALKSGDWVWYDLYANDGSYFRASMQDWLTLWSNPLNGIRGSVAIALQFLSFEFPLTVTAGLIALAAFLLKEWRRGLVLLVLFAMPIVGAMAYSQRAAARGYLVFGISLIVFVALAGFLAKHIRDGTPGRRLASAGFAIALLIGQAAWSGAHFIGHLGPLRGYYIGIDRAVGELTHPPMDVFSLTEAAPRPAWFGGTAPFDQIGLYQAAGPEQTGGSFLHRLAVSLGSRALLSLYVTLLIALVCVLYGRSASRGVVASLVAIYLLPSIAMAATVRETFRFVPIDQAGAGIKCRAMHYTIQLSDDFRRRVAAFDASRTRLELFFRGLTGDQRVPEVALDGRNVAVEPGADEGRWMVKDENWQRRIGAARTVELRYLYQSEVRYLGWQRDGLPGRSLSFDGCADAGIRPAVLPVLELRVVAPDGAPLLVAF